MTASQGIDPNRGEALVDALSEADLAALVRWGRAAIRKERKAIARRRSGPPPGGHDANRWKLQKAEELVALLVETLGYDPDDRSDHRSRVLGSGEQPQQAVGG
jgi:hypothetical protein